MQVTVPQPMAVCCQRISGQPTIILAWNLLKQTENLITIFIHEGFHYFQFSAFFDSGADLMGLQLLLAKGSNSYPRGDLENEFDLFVEGKLLFQDIWSAQDARDLVATETIRRARLDNQSRLYEDYALLMEGTAFAVETHAFQKLRTNRYPTLIPEGVDPQYSHFQRKSLGQLYDSEKPLINRENVPSGVGGTAAYLYGRSIARLLDALKTSNPSLDWQKGLFPKQFGAGLDPKTIPSRFLEYISVNNLSQRLRHAVPISPDAARETHKNTRQRLLTEDAASRLTEKKHIEDNLSTYPFENGWSYIIETGEFIYPRLDNPMELESFANGLTEVFFKGYASIETARKNLTIEPATIPVVIDLLTGTIRFKDLSLSQESPRLICEDVSTEVCTNLTLELPGLRLRAKSAIVDVSSERRETKVRLIQKSPPNR